MRSTTAVVCLVGVLAVFWALMSKLFGLPLLVGAIASALGVFIAVGLVRVAGRPRPRPDHDDDPFLERVFVQPPPAPATWAAAMDGVDHQYRAQAEKDLADPAWWAKEHCPATAQLLALVGTWHGTAVHADPATEGRAGWRWEDHELRLLGRDDLTVTQMAALLRRPVPEVRDRRHQLVSTPTPAPSSGPITDPGACGPWCKRIDDPETGEFLRRVHVRQRVHVSAHHALPWLAPEGSALCPAVARRELARRMGQQRDQVILLPPGGPTITYVGARPAPATVAVPGTVVPCPGCTGVFSLPRVGDGRAYTAPTGHTIVLESAGRLSVCPSGAVFCLAEDGVLTEQRALRHNAARYVAGTRRHAAGDRCLTCRVNRSDCENAAPCCFRCSHP